MPLRPRPVTIPILGLDTNVDPKNAPLGACDIIRNMFFKRLGNGGAELRKRFGVTARPTASLAGSILSGRKLATFNDEQLIFTNSATDRAPPSWDPQSSKWKGNVFAVGAMPHATAYVDTATPGDGRTSEVVDCAIGGGYLCYVSLSRIVVVNLTTGAHVLDTNSGTANSPTEIRVVACLDRFIIVQAVLGTNTLVGRTVSYATPATITVTTTVAADANVAGANGNCFDMIRNGTNDSALLAYRSNTPDMTVMVLNANLTSGGSVTNANVPDFGLCWLNWDFSDGNGYLSYVSSAGGGLKTHTVRQSAFGIIATTVNDAAVVTGRGIAGYRAFTTNSIFVQQAGATRNKDFLQRSSGGAVSVYQRGMGIAAKPFTVGGNWYLTVAYDNSDTPDLASGVALDLRGYFVLEVSSSTPFSATVLAKALVGEGGGHANHLSPGACPAIDSNHVVVPLLRQTATLPNPAFPTLTIQALSSQFMTLDFTQANVSSAPQIGESLVLPGACPRSYNGNFVQELGFHLVPEYPTLTPSNGVSLLTPSSKYQGCIMWSYTDDRGQLHRSSPSQVTSVTMGAADDTITFTCQTCRLRERSNITIEIYLSVANGSSLFLIGTTANDHTVDTVSFTTGVYDDTRIGGCPAIYTGDGTLAHEPLPPARLMVSWRNRLFLAGTEDPTDLWVSAERVPTDGVAFSSANIITMEKEGGAITGLAEMDDRLVLFKRSSIYELAGLGPAPNGDGQFDQPARITATVGTVNPDSIVKTPQGLIFKSLRGFYLLPVGGGLPMRLRAPETFENLTVTGAAVLDDVEQVRFVTSAGTTLVYHFGVLDEFGVGRWTTFTGQVAVDCAVFAGKFCYLQSDGVVQEENNTWADNGASLTQTVRLCWIAPAGFFGDVRLWRAQWLLDITATHTIALDMEIDFIATSVQTPVLAVTAATPVPIELKPVRQDAVAYRLSIFSTNNNEGFRLTALVLELGSHGQLKPVAATQRMT